MRAKPKARLGRLRLPTFSWKNSLTTMKDEYCHWKAHLIAVDKLLKLFIRLDHLLAPCHTCSPIHSNALASYQYIPRETQVDDVKSHQHAAKSKENNKRKADGTLERCRVSQE
jgi:hypothetical protein